MRDPDVNGRVCTGVQHICTDVQSHHEAARAIRLKRSPDPAPRSHGGRRGRAARPPPGDPAGRREAVRAARLPRGDDPPDRRGGGRAAGAGGLLLRPEARALPRHLRALEPLDRGAARRPARGADRPGRAARPCRASSRPSPVRCCACAPAPRASTTRCWWRASSTTRTEEADRVLRAFFDPLAHGLHRRAARRACRTPRAARSPGATSSRSARCCIT